jgi:ABC-type nitrate/sulfonate/bicarbonate transport system substrate-binding protein
MIMTRRTFGKGLLATAAIAGVGAAGSARAAEGTIRLGYLFPNLTTLAYGIADHIGAYKDAGLDVQGQKFTSGQTTEGIQSLFRGDLDVYYGGGPETVLFNSRLVESGKPAALAVISASNPGHTNFVLSNKVQPAQFEDLVGKPLRIGVSSPSSDHLALFRGWLASAKNMTTDDLGWQFLKVEGGNMPTALLTDQLDGFFHSEPTISLAIMNKAGHLYMSGARGDFGANPPPMTFMAASRDFLSKNGDLVRAFLKATQKANDFYKSASKQDMIPIISAYSGTKPEVLEQGYERINPTIGMTAEQSATWWNYIGKAMVERGEISDKMDPARDIFVLDYQA